MMVEKQGERDKVVVNGRVGLKGERAVFDRPVMWIWLLAALFGLVVVVMRLGTQGQGWKWLGWGNQVSNGLVRGGDFCKITEGNLCEGEEVQLTGYVEETMLTPGVGYLFRSDNSLAPNPIYIQDLRFRGVELNGYGVSEEVAHQIPFGSQVVVRGIVVIQDRARCTQSDFAMANPEVCKPGGYRVKITPDAIFSLPGEKEKMVYYSIYGKIKGVEGAVSSCPNGLEICEGHAGRVCHELTPTDLYCNALDTNENSFLVMGSYDRSVNDSFLPFKAYQVNGISYTNQPTNSQSNDIVNSINQVLTTKKAGMVTVYSNLGERVTSFDTGKDVYYDLSGVNITADKVYYIVGNQLYEHEMSAGQSSLVGNLDPQYFDKDEFLYDFWRSDDGSKILFVTSKVISERLIRNYSIRTEQFFVHELNFNDLETNAGVVQSKILYEEEIEGFFHLYGYDDNGHKLLVSKSFATDNAEPCNREQFYRVDLVSGSKVEMATVTDEGNKYCNEEISRLLYADRKGKFLVLGRDYNEVLPAPRPSKITVYSVENGVVDKQEMLAERSLMADRSARILEVNKDRLTVARPRSSGVIYSLERTNEEYSVANMVPVKANEKVIGLSPTPGYHQMLSLPAAEYLFEDSQRWYFMNRQGSEKQLYILNKNTKESFLAASFSLSAETRVVDGKLFVLDFK